MADRQRLVAQRVGEAVRGDALDARAERQQRHDVADPSGQPARDRAAVGTGRPDQPDRARRRRGWSPAARQLGQGEQADVGQGVVDPRTAERADDDDARRPERTAARTASSVSDSSLSGRLRSIGTPAAASAARSGSPSESPSPTHRSMATPRVAAWRAPPSAATTSPTPASQPGQAASSRDRDATSPSARMRASMRSMLPRRSAGRRRGPMLDSGPCPPTASIPRSSASSTPPPARA